MVATNLTALQVSGVPTMGMAGIPATSGNVFFVNSVTGSDGNTGQANNPFATLDYVIGRCTANNGDVIVLCAGHAETVGSASAITCDVAGVTIIGLGEGASRPTFTFSATASTIVVSAASVQFGNMLANGQYGIVCKPSIDAVVSAIVVSGASCTLAFEWQDKTDLIESTRAVLTTAAADGLNCNLKYVGFTTGSGPTNAVRLVGTDNAVINCDFFGLVSASGWVEFSGTACLNVQVYGYMYTGGITNYTRDVIDTISGSKWWAEFNDGSAGIPISGGSGSALGPQAAATVIADLTVATANNTANVLERDVIGNMTDTGVTAVGADKTLTAYAKGHTTMLTVQSLDNTANAFAGDVVGNKTDTAVTAVGTTKSLAAYAKGHTTMLTVIGVDSANNAFAGDVLGNKTDASVYVPGTTNSLAAYAKGTANLQERVIFKAAAVLTDGATLFTIAGGPIQIISLVSIAATTNTTASTLTYSATPTLGAVAQTISGSSGSLATATAGASVTLAGTALATAALLSVKGPNLIANPGTIMVPAGVITSAVGTTTPSDGTFAHYMRYKPLAAGVTVT